MTSPNTFVHDIPRREFLKKSAKGTLLMATAPALISSLSSCSSQLDPGAKTALDPALFNKVIARALAGGGDFADVYVEHRVTRNIMLEESKYKNAVYGVTQGAGVRVISGDKTGYAYTDELTEEKLLRAAEVASAIAKSSKIITPVDVSVKSLPSFVSVNMPLNDVANQKRLDVMLRANEAAMSFSDKIKMTTVSYYDEVRARTIANSEGLLITDELPLLFFIVQCMGEGNGTKHMSRERLSMHSGFEMFDEVSPESIAETAAREAVVMLDAKDCPAGKMDVVMENGWGGVLVHEAVGHPLEADNIAKKIGAFTGKLGKKVASDVFTMVDDGTLPNYRGTTNFDDEGTPMKRNVLIRNGVLENYMTDILSAGQLGLERTGNGRRESFKHMPIPRMTNTFIEAGKDRSEDIIASTKNGIFVKSLSGGSVNSITGMFNFTCREMYLIENGQITVPVKGGTLIGSCMDIISNIDAVGNDLAFGPGICGKGQSAEVTAGQPTVRLRGMTVGGSRA
ncbi:TldD/PmbA family protein [bacterium]|nr:TldD/PmbA family protein [bacterium]